VTDMESNTPAAGIALACTLLLAGCGSTAPSRFYLLAASGDPAREAELVEEDGPLLLVGPVLMPDYLQRDEIVTRAGPSRLVLADYDRWAEPVEQGFLRVLVQDLTRALPGLRVAPELSAQGEPRYALAVSVLRFDLGEDRLARLEVRWTLRERAGGASTARRAIYVRPADGDGYEAAVRALGETIADMSRDVAAAFGKLSGG